MAEAFLSWRLRNPWCALAVATVLVACRGALPVRDAAEVSQRDPVEFEFHGPSGSRLSATETKGRVTALLFGATYDLATQVEAKVLQTAFQRHRPRFQAGLIVLESAEYAPMAQAFGSALGLSYPIALADADTRAGQSGFGSLDIIPILIILDAQGREVWRKVGLASPAELEKGLIRAERQGPEA